MNDHDCIIEMHTNIKHILENQEKLWIKFDSNCDRLDALENWKNKIIGICITFPVIIPIFITLLMN